MEMVLINSESKKDMDLLIKIASKRGIQSRKMTVAENDDYALGFALKKGTTDNCEKNDCTNRQEFCKRHP